ncbi:hypothetical protein AUJ84_02040 [Candidatus Pacearchaeota archaeon CG1_02_32_132]|nr:MAG: hypothetical protein AUJ84_02040 [Candidatus Pacearchaeota archaeon CG1_02_32_132]
MNLKSKVGKFIEKVTVKNLNNEITRHVSGKVVLDDGCGGGSFNYSRHEDKIIHGVDIRKSDRYAGIFKESSSLKLPYEDDSFDCVVFAGVIQYIQDYGMAMREISRVLKKNGRMIIASVNKDSILRRIRIINPAPKKDAGEHNIFSQEELKKIITDNGFGIIKELGVDAVRLPKSICSNSLIICQNEK